MEIDEGRAIRLVRMTGAAMLVIGVVLAVVMPKTAVRANVDGLSGAVIGFELVSTPEQVLGILGGPADAGRADTVRAMDMANRIDFLFMIAYPALCVAIALLLVSRGLAPKGLAWIVGALALTMWAGDLIENLQLLKLSQTTDPAAMAKPLSVLWVATRVKWKALFVTALLEGAYVWTDVGAWRWSALLFVAGGLLGIVGFRWLPGIEHGANVVALAWLWTWIHALRARAR